MRLHQKTIDFVAWIDKEAQNARKQLHTRRRSYLQSLVRDHGKLLLQQTSSHFRSLVVFAHQHGYLAIFIVFFTQFLDYFDCLFDRSVAKFWTVVLFGIRILRTFIRFFDELHLHITIKIFLRFLRHIGIDVVNQVTYSVSFIFICRKQIAFHSAAYFLEKMIVEPHNVFCTAPVIAERNFFAAAEIVFYTALKQFPVGISPAVNALFHVANNQVVVTTIHAIFEQRLEIFPLHRRGVLKFVEHEMFQENAHFFVDKWRVAAFDYSVQKIVG